VPLLLLLEDGRLREAEDLLAQPWLQLQPLVADWRPELPAPEYAERGQEAAQRGHEAQLQLVAALRPDHVSQVSVLLDAVWGCLVAGPVVSVWPVPSAAAACC
jgi:hypothetical protein